MMSDRQKLNYIDELNKIIDRGFSVKIVEHQGELRHSLVQLTEGRIKEIQQEIERVYFSMRTVVFQSKFD